MARRGFKSWWRRNQSGVVILIAAVVFAMLAIAVLDYLHSGTR